MTDDSSLTGYVLHTYYILEVLLCSQQYSRIHKRVQLHDVCRRSCTACFHAQLYADVASGTTLHSFIDRRMCVYASIVR
jgi:hypothetical protein